MSKHNHNYSQYSNKRRENNPKPRVEYKVTEPETSAPEVDPVIRPVLVEETVNTVTIPETISGMVVGCAKLNVRAEASLFADIICTLNNMSEIEIDINKSTEDWFYICTATGIEGYCMRRYVEAHL